jgi:hypothetical protein
MIFDDTYRMIRPMVSFRARTIDKCKHWAHRSVLQPTYKKTLKNLLYFLYIDQKIVHDCSIKVKVVKKIGLYLLSLHPVLLQNRPIPPQSSSSPTTKQHRRLSQGVSIVEYRI